MSHPITLHGANKREAVADVIYRFVLGFDTNNWSLIESAFIKDHSSVILDMGALMPPTTGLDTLKHQIFAAVGPLDTLHIVSNIRIDERGEADGLEKAYVTASVNAQHYRTGDGLKGDAPWYIGGSMYFAEVEKAVDDKEPDGLWRASKFTFKMIWRDGDPDVMKLIHR